MEASLALSDGVRPQCRFLLVLTADQREICFPKAGLAAGRLALRMLSLGAGARDEMHVLETEGAKVNGQAVSQAASQLTLQPCLPTLRLAIDLTAPVTFRLKTGPGPLFISGHHIVVQERNTSAAVAMVTANGVPVLPGGQKQEGTKEDVQIVNSLKIWKRLHEMHGITMPRVGQDTPSSNSKKLCPGLEASRPVDGSEASDVKDSALDSKAKDQCPGLGGSRPMEGSESSAVKASALDSKTKDQCPGLGVSSPAEEQVASAVKASALDSKTKDQCPGLGVSSPAEEQVASAVKASAQGSKAKGLCPGLGVSSPAEGQVVNAVKASAQGPKAKEPCLGPIVGSVIVKNATQETGTVNVPQEASVSKPVKPTLQTVAPLHPSRQWLKEEKPPTTVEGIKENMQQRLIRGEHIPIQIMRFGQLLKSMYKYEVKDYAQLVEMWQWRLSLYKTLG